MAASSTFGLYLKSDSPRTKTKIMEMTPAQREFVDRVYELCEKHYSDGGDTIVECYEPWEVIAQFKTLADVRDFCGLKVEQALNCREGTDQDPEVEAARRFKENFSHIPLD